jgi:2-oxoglutarate ferredoxin oxidoreductase subunit alpha
LIIEALVQAGAHSFVGYPITPANRLYAYASKRFPVFLAAPDEISALQWAAGFAAAGKFPVTATSFPGFALMVETLNMAYMMELPLVVVLAQRMGPSTGSATTGAQGDLHLLRGAISGGYTIPVLCPSSFEDCWTLAAQAVHTATNLRTPVVLLTSKEMIMTNRSLDTERLPDIRPARPVLFQENGQYEPYAAAENGAPPFLPVGNTVHQVRLNASTHGRAGLIQKATPEAIANTRRLHDKIEAHIAEYARIEYDDDPNAGTVVVTYGVTAEAARDAVARLRADDEPVSLLIVKTLLPVPPAVFDICNDYKRIVFAEENLTGSFCELCFGRRPPDRVCNVNRIGRMILPEEIIEVVRSCRIMS